MDLRRLLVRGVETADAEGEAEVTMMTLQTHACASGIDAVSNFIF